MMKLTSTNLWSWLLKSCDDVGKLKEIQSITVNSKEPQTLDALR